MLLWSVPPTATSRSNGRGATGVAVLTAPASPGSSQARGSLPAGEGPRGESRCREDVDLEAHLGVAEPAELVADAAPDGSDPREHEVEAVGDPRDRLALEVPLRDVERVEHVRRLEVELDRLVDRDDEVRRGRRSGDLRDALLGIVE